MNAIRQVVVDTSCRDNHTRVDLISNGCADDAGGDEAYDDDDDADDDMKD